MNPLEPNTKQVAGLDHATIWTLRFGLALVVIGAGMGGVALFAGSDFAFGTGQLWWWITIGGALLSAIGGWRAARRWSAPDGQLGTGTKK